MNQKRLMRSETDKKVLGVCAGLGRYFGIDPLLVRLLFVVATFGGFGSAIPIYVILAFVMPKGDPVYDDAAGADESVDFEATARTLGEDVARAVRSATETAVDVGEEIFDTGRAAFSAAANTAADAIEPKGAGAADAGEGEGDDRSIAEAASSLGDDVVDSVNKAVERASGKTTSST